MSVKVNALDHLVINVTDVKRSAEWYRKSSAWRSGYSTPVRARRRVPRWCSATRRSMCGRAMPTRSIGSPATMSCPGSDDLCFLTSSTPDQVVAHLEANGVKIEEGPVAKQGARGTLRSVYCRDPDGSLIEISSYEGEAGCSRHCERSGDSISVFSGRYPASSPESLSRARGSMDCFVASGPRNGSGACDAPQ